MNKTRENFKKCEIDIKKNIKNANKQRIENRKKLINNKRLKLNNEKEEEEEEEEENINEIINNLNVN
jgi:hypothetical protein